AVVLLGFREVERLALTISVMDLFSHSHDSARTLRLLWRHSVACATAAGVLETVYGDRMAALRGARIAGLIHDIGKAAIAQFLPEAHEEIVRLMHDDQLVAWKAEQMVLDGVTHCDIGAWMTERWNLPPAIVAGVASHHTPESNTDYPEMAHCIHIADWLCNGFGVHSSQLNVDFQPHPAAVQTFNMDKNAILDIQNDLERQRGLMSAVAAGALS
ncbi:MAG: HDOD domain-containing protein, partial [Candidatus Hydrogenedentes bacterium]|nr:HDOD domain-containing protein [Candidatus Hydrogenedentota bacterium]